jgi:hypothetical protein
MAGRAGAKQKGKVGVCIMCRHTFQCARSDKQTCSPKCRKAWQRYNTGIKCDLEQRAQERSQVERLNSLINTKFNAMVRTR